MKRIKLCVGLLLLSAICVAGPPEAAAFQGDQQALPAPEARPTQEQFEAEVEAIQKQSDAYEAEAKRLDELHERAKQAYNKLREQQRGGRDKQNDERKAYREAWDRVRQLLREEVGEDELAPALKEAKALADKLKPDEAPAEQGADDLDARVEAAYRAMRKAYEAYGFARQDSSDYSRLSTTAGSTLRRFDRQGVYESFVKQKQRVDAKLAARKRHVQRLAEQKAEQDKQAAHWEKRWADMTPAQRAIEVERVTVQLEDKQEHAKTLKAQHEAVLKASRELFNRRGEIASEASDLRAKRSDLTRQVRELTRAEADATETEAAEKELDETLAALEKKEAEVQQAYDHYLDKDAETTAAYREWKIADKEVGFIRDRHREASRRVAADPRAPKTDPRRVEVQKIREAWQQVSGKDVQWGENPFAGRPVTSAGNITQDGPDLTFTYDGPGYHAQMHVSNAGRTLHVFDDDARLLFDGPVNHITHLKDFSQELYYLWEFLYTRVNIR